MSEDECIWLANWKTLLCVCMQMNLSVWVSPCCHRHIFIFIVGSFTHSKLPTSKAAKKTTELQPERKHQTLQILALAYLSWGYMRIFVVKAMPLSPWEVALSPRRLLPLREAVKSLQTNTAQQATSGSTLTPHLLPAEACATVFKLPILKPLKGAWKVIYSVAKDSNFIVQRQETQPHWKICKLGEHRFNKITVPSVQAHNSLDSSIPFLKLPGKCFYTVSFWKGLPKDLHRINQMFQHEGWLLGTSLWKELTTWGSGHRSCCGMNACL